MPVGHVVTSGPPSSRPSDVAAGTPRRFFSGVRVVSLCTLASRITGLLRDIGMAAIFGNGPILDAFSVAFRFPNLARRLFGEGALTAAFLPAFVRELNTAGSASAWKLATAVLTLLTGVLSFTVLLIEAGLIVLIVADVVSPEGELLLGLIAVLLPFLVMICVSAQASAILHAFDHFTWPALIPVILNLIWIGALVWVHDRFETDRDRIFAVAGCIAAAGLLQWVPLWCALRRFGFRYTSRWRSAWPQVKTIGLSMLPVLLGLSITQLNSFADGLIAWSFAAPETESQQMPWWPGTEYPFDTGTASALYFGQRMYQFPLGVFGMALSTVLFPLFARHAESGRLDLLRADLSLGLRLTLGIGIPASIGLILLAEPLTVLLFQRGAFDEQDVSQTSAAIRAYGGGVWAYCGLALLHRAYYALGNRQTPLRIGMVAMGLNLFLNFSLMWRLGGFGLALATSISAIVQVVLAARYLEHYTGSMPWREIGFTAAKTTLATLIMAICTVVMLESVSSLNRYWKVGIPLMVALAAYFLCAWMLRLDELWLLFKPRGRRSD